MSAILLYGMAVHAAAGHLAASRTWQFLAGGPAPPNPPAQAPPGLARPVTTIIAWGKWGVLVCGVAVCSSRPGRWPLATVTVAPWPPYGRPIPWVLGGLSLAAVAAAIVGVFRRCPQHAGPAQCFWWQSS